VQCFNAGRCIVVCDRLALAHRKRRLCSTSSTELQDQSMTSPCVDETVVQGGSRGKYIRDKVVNGNAQAR
jgi:hypothetical protein